MSECLGSSLKKERVAEAARFLKSAFRRYLGLD
jgi:hypothetical protein